jgi:endonuclease/exonuclease/phosphatase family metal-dependent hydrolase
MRLKILSYNIHKGFSPFNRNFSLPEIRQELQKIGPHILFLQEVIGENHYYSQKVENWPGQSQDKFLSDALGLTSIYGQNAIYQQGHHGNAIISSFPFLEWQAVNISLNRWEQRGILYAKIRLDADNTVEDVEKSIHLFCTHLNLLNSDRLQQYKSLQELIEQKVGKNEAAILAGDFNDWNKQASRFFELDLSMLEGFKSLHGSYAKTFPSVLPLLSLDRIYVHNLQPVHAEVLSHSKLTRLSDHLPLLLELEIRS